MHLRGPQKCGIVWFMADLITQFEQDCKAASVSPPAALVAGGVHRSMWARWRSGTVSPTLKKFEQAREGLRKLAEAA